VRTPVRFSNIDDSNIADHTRLRADDRCLFLFEYTSGRDYSFSATNSLINNLKKKPTSSAAQLGYKGQAINACGLYFREGLDAGWLERATLVPIPGSKAPDHADFDDRMTGVAHAIGPNLDVRALVRQTQSLRASHEVGDGERVSVEELLAAYQIDESLVRPDPVTIGIMDDVLTAGTHYRAMQTVLSRRFPAATIFGLFVARRVFPA
jgi:predicted amidophosphoribosyltransferase